MTEAGTMTTVPTSRNYRHGHKPKSGASRTYVAYQNMFRRCYNPKHRAFKWYGGRGISVSVAWRLGGFKRFLADMGECPSGLTLDRKDGNGDYSKENCVWATWKVQQNHRRPRTRKEICHRGHLLSGENLRLRKNGNRNCKQCDRDRHAGIL